MEPLKDTVALTREELYKISELGAIAAKINAPCACPFSTESAKTWWNRGYNNQIDKMILAKRVSPLFIDPAADLIKQVIKQLEVEG